MGTWLALFLKTTTEEVIDMNIHLGIVGPNDSIDHIRKIAEKYTELKVTAFTYNELNDVREILTENKASVDQWLFSGQAPYSFAISEGLISTEEGTYPILHGTSLLGKLLEAQFCFDTRLKEISLDTVEEKEIETLRENFSLKGLKVNVNPFHYPGYITAQQLIDYHQKNYDEGSEVIFTCIQSVHQHFLKLNIPCFRIIPTELSIQQKLDNLIERAQANWYKKSQLAIVGVKLLTSEETVGANFSSYDLKLRELELKRLLLNYAEQIQGSLVQIGDHYFFIYTTRGEIESHPLPLPLLEEIELHTKIPIFFVVGYGLTALDAEAHVRLGFQNGRRSENTILIVNEEKQVTEVSEQEEAVSYDQSFVSCQLKAMLNDVKTNPATISKILSMANHYKKDTISSKDITWWLQSSERNARRIIQEMERVGIITVTGEEQVGQRGRPRKIYRIKEELM